MGHPFGLFVSGHGSRGVPEGTSYRFLTTRSSSNLDFTCFSEKTMWWQQISDFWFAKPNVREGELAFCHFWTRLPAGLDPTRTLPDSPAFPPPHATHATALSDPTERGPGPLLRGLEPCGGRDAAQDLALQAPRPRARTCARMGVGVGQGKGGGFFLFFPPPPRLSPTCVLFKERMGPIFCVESFFGEVPLFQLETKGGQKVNPGWRLWLNYVGFAIKPRGMIWMQYAPKR